MVRFIHEIDTSETFVARHTVGEVIALSAIITVLTPEERVTSIAIAYFIAVFTFMDKRTVEAMLGFLKPTTIFTKFIIG